MAQTTIACYLEFWAVSTRFHPCLPFSTACSAIVPNSNLSLTMCFLRSKSFNVSSLSLRVKLSPGPARPYTGLVPIACLTSSTPAVPWAAQLQPRWPPCSSTWQAMFLPRGLCNSARSPFPKNILITNSLTSLTSLFMWRLLRRRTPITLLNSTTSLTPLSHSLWPFVSCVLCYIFLSSH